MSADVNSNQTIKPVPVVTAQCVGVVNEDLLSVLWLECAHVRYSVKGIAVYQISDDRLEKAVTHWVNRYILTLLVQPGMRWTFCLISVLFWYMVL